MSALQSVPGVDTVQAVARHAVSSVQDKTGRVITWTGPVIWDVYKMTSLPCAVEVIKGILRCSRLQKSK